MEEIIFGILQGSIRNLLLFNISLHDLFLFTNDTEVAAN